MKKILVFIDKNQKFDLDILKKNFQKYFFENKNNLSPEIIEISGLYQAMEIYPAFMSNLRILNVLPPILQYICCELLTTVFSVFIKRPLSSKQLYILIKEKLKLFSTDQICFAEFYRLDLEYYQKKISLNIKFFTADFPDLQKLTYFATVANQKNEIISFEVIK